MNSQGGNSTASRISEILDKLADGKWHMTREIQQSAKMDSKQLQQITDFLKEYDFIIIDTTGHRIKLDKMARRLLAQEATV